MAGPTGGWAHRPVLRAELPDGWTVSERATFESPAGTAVDVRVGRAPAGWTTSDLADRLEALARADDAVDNGVTSSVLELDGGRTAQDRRLTLGRDGVDEIHRIVCTIDGDLAMMLQASWKASNETADADVDAAIAGLRLPAGRAGSTGAIDRTAGSRSTARARPPVEAAAWSRLVEAWVQSPVPEIGLDDATRWSVAELSVAATILGTTTFPTIGYGVLGSVGEVELDATVDVVTRSFLARGLVRPGDEGAELVGAFGDLVDVAVFPDLAINVERVDVDGERRVSFAVRPDRAIQVSQLADGSRGLVEVDPRSVVGRLLALTGAGDTSSPAEAPDTVRVTRDDVTRGDDAIGALVGITTAWRVGEQVHGGAFVVAVAADGTPWHAEAVLDGDGSACFELRRTDLAGLRRTVIEHLPGG